MSFPIFVLADIAPYPAGSSDGIGLLTVALLVLGFLALILWVQYWIFKHYQSIVAKVAAGFIYLLGGFLGILGLDGAEELTHDYFYDDVQILLTVLIGLWFSVVVVIFFLFNHRASTGNKPDRAFWIKCGIAAVLAFLAIQADIYLELISVNI
jgi:hypothetical protein